MGDQGGCERRIEVFLKIHKKKFGGEGGGEGSGCGGGGGVRVDVIEELKFWENSHRLIVLYKLIKVSSLYL